jgi:hypothetical protein
MQRTPALPTRTWRAGEATVKADARSIAAWTDDDVRNETRANSPGGRLRSKLCAWLRTHRPPDGQLLEATYGGARRNDADVENLLFNNIDQEAAAYRAACAHGLRFGWLAPEGTAPPGETARAYHYRYRFVPLDASMPGVRLGECVCRWSKVALDDGFESLPGRRMSTRVWWSLRNEKAERRAELEPGSTFAVRLVLHGQSGEPARALKGSFDGVVAALQVQRDLRAAEEAAAVLAGERRDQVAPIFRALTDQDDRALWRVQRLLVPVAAQYGTDLRWDPADSGCIAGEVLVGERGGPARFDVEVIGCELQPSGL